MPGINKENKMNKYMHSHEENQINGDRSATMVKANIYHMALSCGADAIKIAQWINSHKPTARKKEALMKAINKFQIQNTKQIKEILC